MDSPWYEQVKPGDKLTPVAMWNRTSPHHRQLATPTAVLEVVRGQCQHGIMVRVHSTKGREMLLSVGWFEDPAAVARAGR